MGGLRCIGWGLLAVLAIGCGSGSRKPVRAEVVTVEVWCDETLQQITLTGDRKVDQSLCPPPWDAVQIEAGARTEVLRILPGREIWLRRTTDRAFVEVRMDGRTVIIDGVRAVATRDTTKAHDSPEQLTIVHGGRTEQLTVRQLKQRYGAATAHVGEISLCQLATDFGGEAPTITVEGDADQSQAFTRAQCTERGLLLKLSGQGEVRLRTASGERLLRTVRRITL
ncbi:MAG: hypothetical protein AB7P03_14300 [Kofleriaceae bacterium]